MSKDAAPEITPDQVEAIVRIALTRDVAERLPVLRPQIERMYELGRKVRAIDLSGIDPTLVYRVPREEGR